MHNRILIIGSNLKFQNCDVYSWPKIGKMIPLIGDYRNVIIYMPSLQNDSFNESQDPPSIINQRLKNGISDAIKGNTNIYVVTAPITSLPGSNSYKIFPFSINSYTEVGKNFKNKEENILPYIKKITQWQVSFDDRVSNFPPNDFAHIFQPVARTNHEKNASFAIILIRNGTDESVAGTMTFVPPITNKDGISEKLSIEELVTYITPAKKSTFTLPAEYDKPDLPGEAELQSEDNTLANTITSAQKRRKEITNEVENYKKFKGIIAVKGKHLEGCIEVVLNKLGVEYIPTNTNKEDGFIKFSDTLRIPVEIKGHDTKGASEDDLRQVIARLKEDTRKNNVRGALIVNCFIKTEPDKRSKMKCFEPSIIEQAKAFNIALIDTRTLMKFLKIQLEKNSNNLPDLISRTSGEIIYKPDIK